MNETKPNNPSPEEKKEVYIIEYVNRLEETMKRLNEEVNDVLKVEEYSKNTHASLISALLEVRRLTKKWER